MELRTKIAIGLTGILLFLSLAERNAHNQGRERFMKEQQDSRYIQRYHSENLFYNTLGDYTNK